MRGAGQGKTILYFPKSLSDVYGNAFNESGACCTSQYSHTGAFLNLVNSDPIQPATDYRATFLSTVTATAAAGVLRLDAAGPACARLMMQPPAKARISNICTRRLQTSAHR